ncbi:MAG: D-alanine--D-alanine ligase A [Spirochaetes bacterium GWD1_61_31]|nr:MAG: D-alanine--D-alanine ligase A [Spirochaetes bacterium GWB1_60_80]OHD31519.1 MAG: D-alanine--D-alanine ligase A [Spirochaetes bacterium GWC1_61_12]OHD43296.1 MAG: D-alanine--D-alanine ligase A [Spirochaetes bacterium GWD1_61_31]OHD45614.1 MAG: D-alanine--D-alanine ligase A [Spirochaetes bacterium GWE1_60_18]OHD60465.1 MAG: D-alanine--D-alanine ligase A [Spirochaetes bacterium GWF1_60_12]HAP44734.1 D-alanine--D-alanine ligase A [Spirochaetaceae bacterium]
MKIALLFGGKSGEHEVSINSASNIVRQLDPRHKLSLIGISHDGVWYLQPDSLAASCREDEAKLQIRTDCPQVLVAPGKGLRVYGNFGAADLPLDVVIPVLHGSFGEDGTVQGLLECADLAYVGADVAGSAIAMNKALAKRLWQAAGLPVVPFEAISHYQWSEQQAAPIVAEAIQRFGWPLFVKPAGTGSSVGTAKALDAASLQAAVEQAFKFDTAVLIEPFIAAIEVECAVLGNGQLQVFPPGEVAPTATHEFYDYDAKYIDPTGAELFIPARLPAEQLERVRHLAAQAYATAGLAGMARIDFFVDRKNGAILLNEANTIPGFTEISLYPRMCLAGGLNYPQLLDRLMELAIERHQTRRQLQFTNR